ncbi:ATP-binding protein [bacterium]|nr:ATP-binding protein [bacterium]
MELEIPRCFNMSIQSYFLFGPRGTGKSTYLRSTYPEALYIDLLKPDIQRKYLARPETIIEQVHAHPESIIIIIDEIQKVPAILDAVHALIEEKQGYRFILTGSSARKLKRSGVDLLAGRVILRQMHPFLLSELGDRFDFDRALNIGLLPLVTFSLDPLETLHAYIALYIREEVQYEGLVRNIGNFTRFLEVISFSHGAVLNISNVARECEVERKVVENYITILEDILLGTRLRIFSKRAKRALITHPKFYLFDTGVFKTLRPKGPLDSTHEIDGAGLEGLVFQHLVAWNAYKSHPFEIFFWRSRGGVEVDFILYGEDGIYAIEVKNTDKIRPADLRGLREFKHDYPQCKTLLLYRGKERFLKNQILCLPCDKFLSAMHPDCTFDSLL